MTISHPHHISVRLDKHTASELQELVNFWENKQTFPSFGPVTSSTVVRWAINELHRELVAGRLGQKTG